MALKRKIDKEAYSKLTDTQKENYIEKDGSYVLDLEDDGDAGELKRAKDREVQARKEAERKLKEAQEQLDELSGNDAKKRGDSEALEKSGKEKEAKKDADHAAAIAKKDAFIQKALVDGVATSLASKLSGDKANLILPHIKARITADLEGDEPTTKVLGVDGKISALTVADLEKEFVANKDFSSIITGSKASGSGAPTPIQKQTPGGAPSDQNKSLREMSLDEKRAYLDSKKEQQTNEG